jgi:alpha-beta hydrolase superfamily lysophospholipase
MTEPIVRTFQASDGYPIHLETHQPVGPPVGRIVVLHGVQSHAGWYRGLGQTLAAQGFEVHFPDRRGSGSNRVDRGHARSVGRLIADITELLESLKSRRTESIPTTLAGISWGGKLAVVAAARAPELVNGLALICPGLQPRVGVTRAERLRIAAAWFVRRRTTFPIPLSDPALFTANPEAQRFIANDPLSLRRATAGLLAVSTFLDRAVARVPGSVREPTLLMLASEDRIVDNARTRAYCQRLAARTFEVLEYPGAHHTLEFEPDPARYALDLADWIHRRVATA